MHMMPTLLATAPAVPEAIRGPEPKYTMPPSPAHTEKDSRADSISGEPEEVEADEPKTYPLPPKSRANSVLDEDAKTPDSWVERDSRLIRLTGIHPFNVEAPLSDLYEEGFITTKDLHYVRNHGAVPKVEDDEIYDWKFAVDGMVENPIELSVRELMEGFEQVTYPVTLVCAGNRRKEQNIVRKTKGFSWGAAGLSTALWTGVAIGDLLKRARPLRGARYVCFTGADKLPNGYYETSIKLGWCLDESKGVMISYKMNGDMLPPDHGKPVRIIIPGQIGGRSVKWLRKITISANPSSNWYHIYDNRVLPTMITPAASDSLPETWRDERYAIYDLNANSATCYPAHNEKLAMSGGQNIYKVRGYAYGGGGRRITRVEVTLDKGKSWTLANIEYPEDDYRNASDGDMLFGGKMDMSWRETSFCWCFWYLDVPTADLARAQDIMVRCMDEGMMVQPRDMYWSVLGMMNNPWFRVVIHKEGGHLRFEHPTQPALLPGGWMERVKKDGGNITNGFWGEKVAGEETTQEETPVQDICMTNPKVDRRITIDELRKHDGEDEPWFVVNAEVYDGTPFLEGHPGGAASIFGAAGQDATEEFMTIRAYHRWLTPSFSPIVRVGSNTKLDSENAKAMMPEYHIGTLDDNARAILADDEAPENDETRPVFLQSKFWSKAALSAKMKLSPDTKVFVFDLDHAEQTIGLPIGQHLMMRLQDPNSKANEPVIRAYTPISDGAEKGQLHVLVKIYYDTPHHKGGKMTQALDALEIGSTVEFKGPVGKFEYLGRGLCSISGRERRVRRFIMVCAGSGITPIFQVFRAVMRDAEDPTRCLVVDGNRVEEDILIKEELDGLAKANPDRCRLLYTLSRPEATWAGLKGRMDKALFESEVGPYGTDHEGDLVLICGPESMEKSIHSIFLGMGWQDSDLLFF